MRRRTAELAVEMYPLPPRTKIAADDCPTRRPLERARPADDGSSGAPRLYWLPTRSVGTQAFRLVAVVFYLHRGRLRLMHWGS